MATYLYCEAVARVFGDGKLREAALWARVCSSGRSTESVIEAQSGISAKQKAVGCHGRVRRIGHGTPSIIRTA
eukprot:2662911-Karenia_brevis.AAC.1